MDAGRMRVGCGLDARCLDVAGTPLGRPRPPRRKDVGWTRGGPGVDAGWTRGGRGWKPLRRAQSTPRSPRAHPASTSPASRGVDVGWSRGGHGVDTGRTWGGNPCVPRIPARVHPPPPHVHPASTSRASRRKDVRWTRGGRGVYARWTRGDRRGGHGAIAGRRGVGVGWIVCGCPPTSTPSSPRVHPASTPRPPAGWTRGGRPGGRGGGDPCATHNPPHVHATSTPRGGRGVDAGCTRGECVSGSV